MRKKGSNARFQAKIPTIGEYAEPCIAGLRLQNSTIEAYVAFPQSPQVPPRRDLPRPRPRRRLVFGDDNGAIRVPDAVTSRWTRRLDWACAKVDGLPRVTLNGLRHSHATLLLELGEHPKVVQERLGHSTITSTMNIYSHVTPTMQKSAIDRFAAHLGESPAGA